MINIQRRNNLVQKRNIIVYAFVFLIYTACVIALCRSVGLDADKANHVLQAKDILSGNLFFKDWNLTGITFLSTDLLFYEIAVLFFGVSYRAVYVACGLMVSSVIIASYFIAGMVVSDKKQRIASRILAAALLGFPCRALIGPFRVHTGAVLFYLGMFALYYLYVESEKEHMNYLAYIGILVFLGTFGDLLMFIQGVIPVLVLGVLKLLREEKNVKRNILTVMVPIVCVIAALICQRLYFAIGRANPNSYLGGRSFVPVGEWGKKIVQFFTTVMGFSMADFPSSRFSDVFGVLKGVSFFLLLIEVVLVAEVLVKLIKGASCDSLSALLALSFLMAFLAFVLTNMSRPKYMAIASVAGPLLLVRNLGSLCGSFYRKKAAVILLMIMACLSLVGKIREVVLNPYPESNKKNYELISFLEQHNLTHGYASFWNSSNLTVLSGEKIKVRHIREEDYKFKMFNWFNKNSWYEEPANFILINVKGNNDSKPGEVKVAENTGNDTLDSASYGVNEKNAVDFLGKPDKRYEVCGYVILVYDFDLSETLGERRNEAYPLGKEHLFSVNDITTRKYLIEGFSRAESWGTWTDGTNALMRMIIENPVDDLVLRFYCSVYNEPQNITLRANGRDVYEFNRGGIHSVLIPKEFIGEDGLLSLSFSMPEAVSPLELGKNTDKRKLSIGFKSILITAREGKE